MNVVLVLKGCRTIPISVPCYPPLVFMSQLVNDQFLEAIQQTSYLPLMYRGTSHAFTRFQLHAERCMQSNWQEIVKGDHRQPEPDAEE